MNKENEFDVNIRKNFERLSGGEYAINEVFRPADYDWPGDWEGRALLAFCCHYSITGKKTPCMDLMVSALGDKVNKQGFFGKEYNAELIDEQQLSGQSWYLRGLVLYARLFGSETALNYARRTVHNLYLPALEHYNGYPVDRRNVEGGVMGGQSGVMGNWLLSTDVGCAFVPLDGLAHYYHFTKDGALKEPLAKMIDKFMELDKAALKMQTHATLSATRGILKFYEAVKEQKYLKYAESIFDLYVREGMTLTYENFNWFGRRDTWTEPCAVADSLILAIELYKFTGKAAYKKYARRIWFNGLQFCQRANGGAGPNTCVTEEQPVLRVSMYEAPFCCTMRYAEGLLFYHENKSFFGRETDKIVKEGGRYFLDDRLLVKDVNKVFPERKVFTADGHDLILIPSLNTAFDKRAEQAYLKIVF